MANMTRPYGRKDASLSLEGRVLIFTTSSGVTQKGVLLWHK